MATNESSYGSQAKSQSYYVRDRIAAHPLKHYTGKSFLTERNKNFYISLGFGMQATDTDSDLFQKKGKRYGELIGSGVLEIRAQRLCDHKHFQSFTSNASREDGPAPKLWTQMAPDTGHGCWHCWSAALRT